MTNEEYIRWLKILDEELPFDALVDGKEEMDMHEMIFNLCETLEQQSCEDCISREDVLLCLTGRDLPENRNEYIGIVNERLKGLPSVQPKAKVGHWIPIPWELEYESDAQCSVCGEKIVGAKYYKCCPMCMAKMEVKE